MPHYKDGTEARVGDHVIGKPYNTAHDVAGTVVSLTLGVTSCNLQVEYIESMPITGSPDADGTRRWRRPNMYAGEALPRFAHTREHGSAGPEHVRMICRDYGAVSDFKLVSRPSHVEA